jgi:hypothetical protein
LGSINLIRCPDGRAIFRQGYAGHYGIVEPKGKIIIPARYAALSCFNYDNISWVAIEGEGHWCPFGEDGARLDNPNCKTYHNAFPALHQVPKPMDQDKFLSSFRWMQQWLRHAEDPSQPDAEWVSDTLILSFYINWTTSLNRLPLYSNEEWPIARDWPSPPKPLKF